MSVTRLRAWVAIGPLMAMGLFGCSEQTPSATEPGLIPVVAETFEVRIPFESFSSNFRVDGGFGHPSQLETTIVAFDANSGDQSVALIEFDGFLRVISYMPPGGSVEVPDSIWTPIGGDLLLFLDSARVGGDEPYRLIAERITEPFEFRNASWNFAVDSLGGGVPWSIPGGGAVESMGEGAWRPSVTDTIRIPIDSTQAARIVRAATGVLGVRVRTDTDGAQIRLRGVDLEIRVRPSLHPEITVPIRPFSDRQTFISSARPAALSGGTQGGAGPSNLLVGGAPAFRSSFSFQLPDSVAAPPALCAGVTPCSVPLTPGTVVYAGIELRSAEQATRLLAPADTTILEIRPVLAPELLPKSPMGPPIQVFGRRIPPDAFRGEAGVLYEVPVTRFVRDVLTGVDFRGNAVPFAVSLVAAPEPSGLGVLSFAGPGSAEAPTLRLILTRSPGVTLR